MAHVRILQRVFAGGCPRDVTKCTAPLGFRRLFSRVADDAAGGWRDMLNAAASHPCSPGARANGIEPRRSAASVEHGGLLRSATCSRGRALRRRITMARLHIEQVRPLARSRAACAGWCGDVDARDMSPAEIEARAAGWEARLFALPRGSFEQAFSWKCKASWPCAAPCKLDFGSCPVAGRRGSSSARGRAGSCISQAWRSQGGGACAAPAEYNGMCRRSRRRVARRPRWARSCARSRAADFSNQTASQKASWAAMCDVAWLAFVLGASRSRIAIRMRCFAGRAREDIFRVARRDERCLAELAEARGGAGLNARAALTRDTMNDART